MRFALSLFRLGLWLFPRAFRERYGLEMERVFRESWTDARRAGSRAACRFWWRTTIDLIANAVRERTAAVDRVAVISGFAAIAAGGWVAWVDFRATEVQATLLLLVATSFVLGAVAPRGAWRRALIVAAILPISHVVAFAVRETTENGHPYWSRILIFLPAVVATLVGAYAGVLVRFGVREFARAGENRS